MRPTPLADIATHPDQCLVDLSLMLHHLSQHGIQGGARGSIWVEELESLLLLASSEHLPQINLVLKATGLRTDAIFHPVCTHQHDYNFLSPSR